MRNITQLFTKLVTIDSPSGHEEKMSTYLLSWLKEKGFEAKADKAGNLYARNKAAGTPLLLCAHMDTVQPGEGIKPVVTDGVIKSDGKTILGADNKAALAAIITAVEAAKDSRPLELLFTVREETGGGVEFFPFEWLTAKQGLIFDSSRPLGGIVLRSPFIVNFTVTLKGKAVHASIPQEGENAFVPTFQALSALQTGLLDDGETTVNVGLIKGGTGINTVPGDITIKGEVRSYSKVLFDEELAAIKSLFMETVQGTRVTVEYGQDGYCPGYAHEKTSPLIQKLENIIKDSGLPPVFYPLSGVSDANVLNEKGIKAVNLTDGTRHSHTAQEEVAVADLEKLAALIRVCITKL